MRWKETRSPGTRNTGRSRVDGAEAEVIDNPGVGIWLFARYLSSPSDATLVGQEDMIFAQNVVAFGRPAGAI